MALCLILSKHHPEVSYVQNVKTWRMILFTFLQALGLAVLWMVKEIKVIALVFPFFVVLMIPFRYCLKFVFTDMELEMVSRVMKVVKVGIIRFALPSSTAPKRAKTCSE